ncbi:MAG: protein kinase domain-containing protein [Planctomycetota bacterium]
MSGDLEERMGQLCDKLQQALDAGQSIDTGELAERFAIPQPDVLKALQALRAMHDVLGEDAVAQQHDLAPPRLSDDYEVLDELGRGGMGVVYRAHQKSLDRDLAVKVLRPGDLLFGDAIRRFEREAKSLARLRHRHIVSVHEVGKTDGFVYFTMDLVDGCTLAERLEEGPMPTTQAVKLLLQVSSAMAYAHGKGVMHRDLKPGNVLLDGDGDAFVCDFGLARELGSEAGATLTGQMLGTPAYMAPEQALGQRDAIGERTDVYALGAILYQCLSGRPPFADLPLAQLMQAVLERDPVPLRRHGVHVPADLEVICEMAMHKDPAQRYATVQAFAEDLERFSTGKEILARPRTEWSWAASFVRRNRNSVFAALAPVAVLSLCAWLFVLPAWMQGRTLMLARQLRAAGNTPGALAAFENAHADKSPGDLSGSELIELLGALVDEAARSHVRGSAAEHARADDLVARAESLVQSVEGEHHAGFLKLASGPDGLPVQDYYLDYVRLAAMLPDKNGLYRHHPSYRKLLEDDTPGRGDANSLAIVHALASDADHDAWHETAFARFVSLLPVHHRLPEATRERMNHVARGDGPTCAFVERDHMERILGVVMDRSLPFETRRCAAALFHRIGWLPFLHAKGPSLDGIRESDLNWLEQAWQSLRGLDRRAAYVRRIDLVLERLIEAQAIPDPKERHRRTWRLKHWLRRHTGQSHGPKALRAWWREHRDLDPRQHLLPRRMRNVPVSELTIDDLLQQLASHRGEETARVHHLLELTASDATQVPLLTIWNQGDCLARWRQALGRSDRQRRVFRAATFAIGNGEATPRLIGQHRQVLGYGEQAAWHTVIENDMPYHGLFVGRHRHRTSGGLEKCSMVGRASIRWSGDDATLSGVTTIRTRWTPGLSLSHSDSANSDCPEGLVTMLGGATWQSREGATGYAVFALGVLEPAATATDVWDREDWVQAIQRTLDHLASLPDEYVTGHAQRIAAAAFFPMADKVEALRELQAKANKHERSSGCVIPRKAGLLLAGDEAAIRIETGEAGMSPHGIMNPTFFARLATTTDSETLRAYAFAQLAAQPVPGYLLRRLASTKSLDGQRPDWLDAQARSTPSPVLAWVADNAKLLLLLIGHVLIAALALRFTLRARSLRRDAAKVLWISGMLLPLWSLRASGMDWNPSWLGHGLHVLGAWAICWRLTRSPVWLVAPLFWTGATIAFVTDSLEHPILVGLIAIVGIVLQSLWANTANTARRRLQLAQPA